MAISCILLANYKTCKLYIAVYMSAMLCHGSHAPALRWLYNSKQLCPCLYLHASSTSYAVLPPQFLVLQLH